MDRSHHPTRISRRDFVRLSLTLTGGALLAACTPSAPSPAPAQPTEAPKAAPAAKAAPTAAEKAAAQAGFVPDRPVKVGLILPLSGNAAPAAVLDQAGMRHALKEYEAKGWKFEVLLEDTQYDATQALRVTQKLIERDRVDFLLGPIGSHEALAIRDTVDQSRTIMSTASAVARDLTGKRCSKYIWRSTPTSFMYGLGYGPWQANNLGKKAYILTTDIAVGHEIAESISIGFKQAGGQIVGEAKAPLTTTDFAPFMGPILNSGADFVTGFFSGKQAIDLLKTFHQFGVKNKMKIAYGVAFTSNDIIDAQGPEATEGVYEYVEFSESLETPQYKAWAKQHQEWFPEIKRIAHYSMHGYTAARSVLLGIEKARSLDPDKVSAAMEGLSYQAPHGPIKFGPNHQATLNMYVTQVRNMNHVVVATVENQTDPNAGECKL